MKDEATYPTGSLKHRLARSLFLYAQLLELPFVAVVPETTLATLLAAMLTPVPV